MKEYRFRHLAAQGLLTHPTQKVLELRLEEKAWQGPTALSQAQFNTLAALCDYLRPPVEEPTATSLAIQIEIGIREERTNGWRYVSQPPLPKIYRIGLAALDDESQERYGILFAETDASQADELISALQKGEFRTPWLGVDPGKFLETVLVEVVRMSFAHPSAQDAIGYTGYADAQGYRAAPLSGREEWEP